MLYLAPRFVVLSFLLTIIASYLADFPIAEISLYVSAWSCMLARDAIIYTNLEQYRWSQ
ncbi:hypothetical protein BGX38DRAFT_1154361 [Terfezia claveryi]|nr:hypothetical protein BGX38DRAFT_1154361 [Terfezia claveryi]